MIDVDEAHRRLFAQVGPGPTVEIPLRDASYRTLVAPVLTDLDSPPFDRSVMDGYAVRSEDVSDAPVTLRVVGVVQAGSMPTVSLSSGETMQINTGAPIPKGADAVVRVEETKQQESGAQVLIKQTVRAGNFIQPRASYRAAGAIVLDAGTILTPTEVGTAATAGAATLRVYRRPTVAVLSTGDELVDVDHVPTGAQIRDSNRYQLEALVRSAHAEPVVLESASDDRSGLLDRVQQGLGYDCLCITGGVSMGAFDFVPEVLESCGASVHIRKMAIKPGRPVIFATAPSGTLIFALPGNPGGMFVGFELLVRPALAALEGRPWIIPPTVSATLLGALTATTDRRTFVPARAALDGDGGWVARPLSWGGSGDALGMAGANGLIDRPPNSGALDAGSCAFMRLVGAAYAGFAITADRKKGQL